MTVLYIDCSHHDWDRRGGNLDWTAVRAATSPVMVARATYGDPGGWNRISRHFGDFQRGAAAAGFTLRGGYHNLVRGDAHSIARQVDWLRGELDLYGCTWAMADVEPYTELVTATMWPRWVDVQRFHDRWYQVESRIMAWYIPRWFWAWRDKAPSLGQPDLRGLHGPLVQSHYAGGDGTPAQIYANAGGDAGTGWDDLYGGRYPDIWQFSAGADVAGASNSTDINAFRGTLAELGAVLTGAQKTKEIDMFMRRRGTNVWLVENHQARILPDFESVQFYMKELGYESVDAIPEFVGNDDAWWRVAGEPWAPMRQEIGSLAGILGALRMQVAELSIPAPAPVDPDIVAAALTRPDILAAIAAAVADEGHRRSAQ